MSTNYHVPCTLNAIRDRLVHPTIETVEDPIKCNENFECIAVQYECGRPYC